MPNGPGVASSSRRPPVIQLALVRSVLTVEQHAARVRVNQIGSRRIWSAVRAAEGSATVTGASVIADGDQAPGVTDVITGLQFAGVPYN
jgi:hypothetical protein